MRQLPLTRAWLTFLERQRLIPSARAIERQAILAGSQFSRLRYPNDEWGPRIIIPPGAMGSSSGSIASRCRSIPPWRSTPIAEAVAGAIPPASGAGRRRTAELAGDVAGATYALCIATVTSSELTLQRRILEEGSAINPGRRQLKIGCFVSDMPQVFTWCKGHPGLH